MEQSTRTLAHQEATVLLAAVLIAGAGVWVGTTEASAAPMPTVAVAASGNTDWAVAFDTGRARTDRCDVFLDDRVALADTAARTATIDGSAVVPGRHPVRVRCGRVTSPTIWLYAPRNQLNDVATWASNTSAGALGI